MQQEEEKQSEQEHQFTVLQSQCDSILARSADSKSVSTERFNDNLSEQVQDFFMRFKKEDYIKHYKDYFDGNTKIKEGAIRFRRNQDSFQKVHLYLSRDKLIFYTDVHKKTPLRHIHLKYFDFEISIVDKITLQITIESSRFQFQTESEIERKIWVKCFQSVRDRHVNTKKMGFNPASYLEKYIYDDLISEEEFFQVAETGDLLLLETENTGAKIQRMITSSKFGKDHVALVVRITDNILFIFDSNADTGVTFIDWKQFIVLNDLYEKIAIRKLLNVDRVKLEENLMQFLNDVHGMKYNVSLNKLFRSESPRDQAKGEYFCSELVAKCYKRCGLLNTTKASSSFWPVHFTRELKLVPPCQLQPPVTILLKKHLRH